MFFFSQIIDAFTSGVEAFKDLKNRYGLTEDGIDNTMIQIQEVTNLLYMRRNVFLS